MNIHPLHLTKVSGTLLYAFIFIILITAPAIAQETQFPENGLGTPEQPYQIESLAHLNAMRDSLGSHYILMNDIDASPTSSWNGGAGWVPVGTEAAPFTGSFDGNGKTINGLYINSFDILHIGLFGYADQGSIIKNIGLTDVNVKGYQRVGALAGVSEGEISKSYATGVVSFAQSTSRSLGGLVGGNFGLISESYSTADVSAPTSGAGETGRYIGGLAGYNDGGVITQSYSMGSVSGRGDVGGLTGWNGNEATVSNSYSTGEVSGTTATVGGFIGNWLDGALSDNYWNTETSATMTAIGNLGAAAGVTGLTTAQMVQQALPNWDFDSIWAIIENGTFPYLRWQGEPGIHNVPPAMSPVNLSATIEELSVELVWQRPAYGLPLGYRIYRNDELAHTLSDPGDTTWTDTGLTNLTTYTYYVTAVYAGDVESGPSNSVEATPQLAAPAQLEAMAEELSVELVWQRPAYGSPLGYRIYRNDELAHTLSDPGDTTWTDTGLTNLTTYTYYVTAVYAGDAESGPSNSVEATPNPFAGGVGTPENPYQISMAEELNMIRFLLDASFILTEDIDLSEATREGGEFWNSGAGWEPVGTEGAPFIGSLDGDGNTITGLFINRPALNYTGLFGYTGSSSEIKNLGLVDGSVTGDEGVGALVGYNSGTISKSYAYGSVSGTVNIGGLVGYNYGTINKCYAIGSVEANAQGGGLVGLMSGAGAAILNSYAISDVQVDGNWAGGIVSNTSNATKVEHSYAAGRVSAGSLAGGISGSGGASFSNNYWNTETSGLTNALGQGSSTGNTGLTSAQMVMWDSFDEAFLTEKFFLIKGLSFPYLPNVSVHMPIALEITGREGWRMVGASVEQPAANFFQDFWMQGIEGANSSEGAPNLYYWSEKDTSFKAPDSMNQLMRKGTGYIHYIYKDDVYGEEGSFPKWLYTTSAEKLDTLSIPVSATDVNGDAIINGNEGWNLLANPYPYPITVEALLESAELIDDQVNLNIYYWDPNEGAEGSYIVLEHGAWQEIPPFQAFFMRFGTAGLQDSLILDPDNLWGLFKTATNNTSVEAGKVMAATDRATSRQVAGVQSHTQAQKQAEKEKVIREPEYQVNLELLMEGKGLSAKWEAVFADSAQSRRNVFHLPFLAQNYINLTSVMASNRLVKEFFSASQGVSMDIPLHISVTQNGEYTISANLAQSEGWELWLTDVKAGIITDLIKAQQYTFTASAGSEERFLLTVTTGLGLSANIPDLPIAFGLDQNYPNPFNPSTTIRFQLPKSSEVRLEVFDVLGRKVATLVDGHVKAGVHHITFDARHLASGMYIYRMQADGKVFTHKLTLIK